VALAGHATVADALRAATGESASQVRRWIEQKGVQQLNGEAYEPLAEADLKKPAAELAGQVLKVGKRNYYKFD